MLKGGNFGKTLVAVSEDPVRGSAPGHGFVPSRRERA
jgi:hypothetical protein